MARIQQTIGKLVKPAAQLDDEALAGHARHRRGGNARVDELGQPGHPSLGEQRKGLVALASGIRCMSTEWLNFEPNDFRSIDPQ